MSWTNAVYVLRQKINDGPTDKLRALKKCFGNVDGVNASFKTFEFRRITDFTQPEYPEGVYIDGAVQPASGVIQDFSDTGFFKMYVAPSANQIVEATYYIQWFLDQELDAFLKTSYNWLLSSDNYPECPDGLKPCVLSYAAGEAYQKLALKYSESQAEVYQAQGAPAEDASTPAQMYSALSKMFFKEATTRRDEFYTRQGRPLQPLRGYNKGNVPKVTPNR